MLVLDLGIEFELNNTELVEVDEGVFEVQSNALRHLLEDKLHTLIGDMLYCPDCGLALNFGVELNDPFWPDDWDKEWRWFASQVKINS